MLRYLLSMIIVAFMITACSKSDPETTLSFNPKDGEQRRYQMYSDTKISAETRSGKRSEQFNTVMLLDYEVKETTDSYSVHMAPQYMQMKLPQGKFRSFEKLKSSGADKDIRAMMEAGFTADIDKDTHEITNFIIHQESEKLRSKGFDPIQEILNDEFGRPGFVSDLEIKKGAEQIIEMKSPLPPVTVRVEEFTDTTVTLSASGNNDEAKVFGYAIMERDSGWTKRLTMVIDMPLPKQSRASEGAVRMVTSIYPEDWMYGQNLDALERSEPMMLDNSDFKQKDTPKMAQNEAVFANQSGELKFRNGLVSLSYFHPSVDFEAVGFIKISDLEVKDKNGESLAMTMHNNAALTYSSIRGENVRTIADFFPLGWSEVVDNLEQMGSIEATLERYAVSHEIVELPVDKAGSSIEMQGATATLIPTDDEKIFDLKIASTKTSYFNTKLNGVSGGLIKYDKASQAPDWIKAGESRALAITKAGNYPITMQVSFMDGLPDSIKLKFTHYSDNKLAEKRVTFYDEDTLKNDTTLAPISNVLLFPPKKTQKNQRDLQFNTASLQALKPVSFASPQLYLTLTPEQATICDLQVTSDSKDSGSKLVMKENLEPDEFYYRASNLKMTRKAVYQLMTADGVQRYFYDQQVALKLSCKGEPSWQTQDITLAERNWMIPLESLLGKHWQDTYTDMPMSDFLRNYRFVDAKGRALVVLPKDSTRRSVDYFTTELSEFITNDGFLRIGGQVDKVEKLIATGKPFTKSWSHQLPSLPDFDSLQEVD